MKCEMCDSPATVHITDLSADEDSAVRSLCEAHAREAGLLIPSAEESRKAVLRQIKLLADFLRTERRMPSSDELMPMGGSTGPAQADTEDKIDEYVAYLDSVVAFVERNGRFPTDEELPDPF